MCKIIIKYIFKAKKFWKSLMIITNWDHLKWFLQLKKSKSSVVSAEQIKGLT